MRKIHYKHFYVIINLNDLSISLTANKTKVSNITGIHRNTVAKIEKRLILNGFIVNLTKEQ